MIKISDYARQRCRAWAKDIMRALKEQRSAGSAAAARLTSHGIDERDQMLAKLAEVAFCKWCGLDWEQKLGWGAEPDDGTDVEFAGRRWDVKHTEAGQLLLWPFNKVHTLQIGLAEKTIKKFDTFVLVRGDDREMEVCGWCQRWFFEQNYEKTTKETFPRLTEGTLVLKREKLRDIAELESFRQWLDLTPLVRACYQCGAPYDGTEREVLIGSFLRWLHPKCEAAFMERLK